MDATYEEPADSRTETPTDRTTRGNTAGRGSGPQQFGDAEGQVERLPGVEAGITGGGVALVELALDDVLDASEALGDVVSGQFHVYPSGPGPLAVSYTHLRAHETV